MSESVAVDTNVLVYRYDPSHPRKQARAVEILRRGAEEGTLVVPFQALVEFVSATTRPRRSGLPPLLPPRDAWREVADFADIFEVLYADADVLPAAISLAAVHGLSWYDATLLAHTQCRGVPRLLSEDFEDGRRYGGVTVVNPFA